MRRAVSPCGRGQHTSWRESHFLRELGWREFAHHLLFHFPETPEQPLRARFAALPVEIQRDRLGGLAARR